MAMAASRAQQSTAHPRMDDAEFERWVRLLETRTGVTVPPERKPFLAGIDAAAPGRSLRPGANQRLVQRIVSGGRVRPPSAYSAMRSARATWRGPASCLTWRVVS